MVSSHLLQQLNTFSVFVHKVSGIIEKLSVSRIIQQDSQFELDSSFPIINSIFIFFLKTNGLINENLHIIHYI